MTKANDLASLLDANGDVVSSALDNVPPSNDASALSTGTLPDGRFPAVLPAVSGANLTNLPAAGIANVVDDTTPELGGTLTAAGYNILFGDSTGGGNNRIKLGNSNDLEIYHNSGNSIVADTGTGDLYLAGDNLRLTNAALSKAYARGYNGGKFSLMYDNAEKLATTASGISVTGDLSVSGSIAGAGKVLQVVNATTETVSSISGTTFADVLSLNITPTSTSSKILLTCQFNGASDNRYAGVKLYRGTTQVAASTTNVGARVPVWFPLIGNHDAPWGTNNWVYCQFAHFGQHLDAPASTSQLTYKITAGNTNNTGGTVWVNAATVGDSGLSYAFIHRTITSLTATEIAG